MNIFRSVHYSYTKHPWSWQYSSLTCLSPFVHFHRGSIQSRLFQLPNSLIWIISIARNVCNGMWTTEGAIHPSAKHPTAALDAFAKPLLSVNLLHLGFLQNYNCLLFLTKWLSFKYCAFLCKLTCGDTASMCPVREVLYWTYHYIFKTYIVDDRI